ncbi:MAG: MotA/TolQ/ExbB proton channel family protein [Asticcacaulis sp.]
MTSQHYNLAIINIVADASLPVQGLILILIAAIIAALAIGSVKLSRTIDGGSALLAALRWEAPLAGGLGAVYTSLFSFLALDREGPSSLTLMAPGLAEACLLMGLGLAGGLIAAIANGLINARIDRAVLGE